VESDEGIATNILTDRLRKLEAHDIITTEPDSIGWTKIHVLAHTKTSSLIPNGFDRA
jgi:DNA-binding HxlR family transcriptional regulator